MPDTVPVPSRPNLRSPSRSPTPRPALEPSRPAGQLHAGPASVDRLFEVKDAISAEAEWRGLTDEIIEEELAAYNAERRERPTHSAEERTVAARTLAAGIRMFRRDQTLGGICIRDLIDEGRR